MTHDEWLEGFNAAPDAVQEYLLGPSSGTAEDAAQTRLAYDNDAWDRLMDAVWDLLFKKSSRGEFEAKLKIVAGDRKPEEVERVVVLRLERSAGERDVGVTKGLKLLSRRRRSECGCAR